MIDSSPGLHVLIVEDNPIYQKMATRILERDGHRFQVVGDGQAALDVLQRQSFDVVLMDLEMPVLGGLDATRAIRQRGNRIPIIAVTSCGSEDDRRRCLDAGMNAHLVKPVQPALLLQTIRDLVVGSADQTMDYDALLQRVDGDRALLREVVAIFLEDAPKLIDEIRASIAKQDADQLRRAAHTLRGSLANFGAPAAQRAAHSLETMGRSGQFSGAAQAFATLAAALDALRPILEGLLSPCYAESKS